MECAASSLSRMAVARARCPQQASLSRGAPGARALRRLGRRCERPGRKVFVASASYDGSEASGGRAQLDVASALKARAGATRAPLKRIHTVVRIIPRAQGPKLWN